ncbi:class D sortase [Alkalihalobacillus sp. AL-G]|uniref:class D sortase n=1 Tax=Alkalihalobacillus sp. AL-G TaxID=2926399 RepID=UPI002729A9E6|nr:class D sortase [Alkalihalobacillus sp. AL-G]WLD91512.1 class D sortase [Alkalihalobacillus sp. AL-G]
MRILLALVIIFIGIGVASFPYLKAQYSLHQQDQLLEQWKNTNSDKAKQSYTSLTKVFASDDSKEQAPSTGELLGSIKIPEIDLEMPILEGATIENMKKAAGHLEGTAPLGEEGNAAIAAHRSYTYGKDFNRLDEIDVGDEISITTNVATYTYTVFNTMIVLPDDTSVLKSSPDKSIMTLITCEPIKDPTHRLIVQASLKKSK